MNTHDLIRGESGDDDLDRELREIQTIVAAAVLQALAEFEVKGLSDHARKSLAARAGHLTCTKFGPAVTLGLDAVRHIRRTLEDDEGG